MWSSRRWRRSVECSVSFWRLRCPNFCPNKVSSQIWSLSFFLTLYDRFTSSQTSGDQRSCLCWSLQMIPLRRRRRKIRTRHRTTSGTSILPAAHLAQVLELTRSCFLPGLKPICHSTKALHPILDATCIMSRNAAVILSRCSFDLHNNWLKKVRQLS